MFLKQFYRQQDQVVEVHRVERLERALVVGVNDGSRLFLGVARVFQGFGRQNQIVLPGADHVLDFVDAVVARIFLLHDVGHQGFDVGFVEDRETGFVAQPHVFLADDVQAQIVERAHGQAAAFTALEQRADPFLHLARGLVGEGHGDDVLGADAAVLDQVRDFARDHAGLAGARAGEHQKRAADVAHGFLLPGIESGHTESGSRLRNGPAF